MTLRAGLATGLHAIIAKQRSRYYDPGSDRPGRGPLKLQQNSHFQRLSSSFSRDGHPIDRSRANTPGQTLRTHHLAAH
jgi:hypothetical protein